MIHATETDIGRRVVFNGLSHGGREPRNKQVGVIDSLGENRIFVCFDQNKFVVHGCIPETLEWEDDMRKEPR